MRLLLVAMLALLPACPKPPPPPPPPDAGGPADAGVVAAPEPPRREATQDEVANAIVELEKAVKVGLDPKVPWALAHGLLVFGKDYKLPDGRKAIDVMVGDFVTKKKVKLAGSGKEVEVYGFPGFSSEGEPVEPHPQLIVKSLVEVGVPLDTKFKIKAGGTVTLGRLLDDIESQFETPTDSAGWHRYPWAFTAIARARSPADAIAKAAKQDKRLSDFALQTITALENEQSFLVPAFTANDPGAVKKEKQGIYSHPCGGLHFIQAAILAAAHLDYPMARERVKKQLEILLFRWRAERRIYRDAFERAPEYALVIRIQEMKFYGHVLETFALAAEKNMLPAVPNLVKTLGEISGDLVDVVNSLEPAYKDMETLRVRSHQSWLDLIGDGCHAAHGLRGASMAFFRPL